jgi:hypothetical protein
MKRSWPIAQNYIGTCLEGMGRIIEDLLDLRFSAYEKCGIPDCNAVNLEKARSFLGISDHHF